MTPLAKGTEVTLRFEFPFQEYRRQLECACAQDNCTVLKHNEAIKRVEQTNGYRSTKDEHGLVDSSLSNHVRRCCLSFVRDRGFIQAQLTFSTNRLELGWGWGRPESLSLDPRATFVRHQKLNLLFKKEGQQECLTERNVYIKPPYLALYVEIMVTFGAFPSNFNVWPWFCRWTVIQTARATRRISEVERSCRVKTENYNNICDNSRRWKKRRRKNNSIRTDVMGAPVF